ncbi:MAG: hypothetical protein EA363_04565, partial [Balneolaceae bacterium]
TYPDHNRHPECNKLPAAGNRTSGGLAGSAIARICQLALLFFLLHFLQIAFPAHATHAAHLLPFIADAAQAQSADDSGSRQPLAQATPADANRTDEPSEPATGATATGASAAGESRPQALFNRGNYMMEQQDYGEAVAIFQQIEQNGHASGALFYNMGISYLYLDSLGQASYYFHKSKAFRESVDRAREGVATVERLMRIRGTFIPQLPWYAFFDWFLFHMNHVAWIVWGLVLINMGVLVILTGWLYRPDRRIAIAGMALSAMGIVQVVVTISISVWASGYQQGVVVENGIPITPSPDMMVDVDLSPDLAYEAYTVTLDKRLSRQHDSWVHIRLRNGVSGWIPESAVQKL